MRSTARNKIISLCVFTSLTAIVACGDARLRDLKVGMARDSVLVALGSAPPDSEAFLFDKDHYIVDGKDIEVFYYDPKSRMAFVDSAPGEELTPVVLLGGKVSGWGWDYWDSVATSVGVQSPHKPK